MGNCACLTMNGVGKPCAGELHARFDRGPLGKVDAQARWNTCTQRETDGTEPIRRTGHTEPAAYLTSTDRRCDGTFGGSHPDICHGTPMRTCDRLTACG